jgi:chitinase
MTGHFRFFTRLICLPVLVSLAAGAQNDSRPVPKRLVADYGYWSRTQTPPYSASQIPFNKLTHLNHAGMTFNADGSLNIPDGFLEPVLIHKAHAAGVRVMLLLGGDFSGMENTAGGMHTLIKNLGAFVAEHGYDGLDIDWEYPSTRLDEITFFHLMLGLRTEFPSPRYVLSADVAPWGGSGYDFPHTTPLVDYFNIMTYDCAGPWTDDGQLNSPIFPDLANPEPYMCEPGGSVEEPINIYERSNVPLAKMNIGTPFYGYFYTNVSTLFGPCTDCGNTVLSENYGTFIKQRINARGWRTSYDLHSMVPYMLRADGKPGYITYDDPLSTFSRVSYALWRRGTGGTFMWSLDADYDGTSQDLLDAMYEATVGASAFSETR